MRAVVTGGAGFIGSHLVDALIDAGHDVVAVDDLSSGRRENLEWSLVRGARLVRLDIRAANRVRRLMRSVRPEVVYHLAAHIDVTRAVADPLFDASANVVGTIAVLDAARACGAGRFVLASTGGAIYGEAAEIPTPERAAIDPLSPYGASKAAAEHYVALYDRLHGVSGVALRLANVYGPRQGATGEGGVIARYCRARVTGVPARVFGDGLQSRDYVHVRDVAAAFVAAGMSEANGRFNVGTGVETTVLELLARLELQAQFEPARPGEVRRSCLDAGAARRVLGWNPRVSLADGLPETLAWASDELAAAA